MEIENSMTNKTQPIKLPHLSIPNQKIILLKLGQISICGAISESTKLWGTGVVNQSFAIYSNI